MMRVTLCIGLVISALACPAMSGQTKVTVHECVKRSKGSSANLEAALSKSVSGLHSVIFAGEGSPCEHTGALLRDLRRLVPSRYLVGLNNHYFAYLKNDSNALNVEQLEFATEAAAIQIEKRLGKPQFHITSPSGSTTYEYFRHRRLLVFFVAPYRGWTPGTSQLVQSIQTNYAAALTGK